MAIYELYSADCDEGMMVCGAGLDVGFRREADAHDRPDERLVTVDDPEALLDPAMLKIAAAGRLATIEAHKNT